MNLHSNQQPVVGGIYHDKTGRSLVVLTIVGGKVLLEYANGTVTSIDAKNWQPLEPHVAVY
jgi:fructose-1,6-bisphosphatase/inositol monophosphatase family enzyme